MESPPVKAYLALPLLILAQGEDRNPRNNPDTCPYCMADPELMGPAGIVSHGGFEFGRTDTDGVDDLLASNDIRWIETEHFEIGFAGPPYRASGKEKKKIEAELVELEKVLPEIMPKSAQLDPWLRAHLFAARSEQIWDRFLEVMQVDESVFPDGTKMWDGTGTYHGEGPYVGQKGKFEMLILPGVGDLTTYLSDQYGLTTNMTNRWNNIERDSIVVTMHMMDGDLKKDIALHGHVAFNLAHNLLDGFEHYSYDTPIWIHEGLAHVFEREISPKYNSFDGGEGGVPVQSKKDDWDGEVRKMIKAKKAPRLASKMAIRTYSELTLEDHFAMYSMVKFLMEEHPDGFAELNKELHGRMDKTGFIDSQNLPEVHREAFKTIFGWTYLEFDEAWSNWALGIEPKKDEGDTGE